MLCTPGSLSHPNVFRMYTLFTSISQASDEGVTRKWKGSEEGVRGNDKGVAKEWWGREDRPGGDEWVTKGWGGEEEKKMWLEIWNSENLDKELYRFANTTSFLCHDLLIKFISPL